VTAKGKEDSDDESESQPCGPITAHPRHAPCGPLADTAPAVLPSRSGALRQLPLALPLSDPATRRGGGAAVITGGPATARTAVVVRADYFPAELAQLCATAARTLDLHTSRDGLCADCGCTWPCERAVLAEHNLSLL
jgi:hypothetical protein